MITRNPPGLLLVAAVSLTTGCSSTGSTRIWSDILAKCAEGAQVGNVLYLTTSNNIGPGSIWRKSSESGYQAVRLFDTSAPGADAVINSGAVSSCNGARFNSTSVGGNVDLDKLAALTDAKVGGEFRRARSVTVGADSWAWDEVLIGPFRDMIGRMDSTTPYRRDLELDTLVIGRAVRVNNLTASLTFERSFADSLRVKLPAGLPGGVSVQWTGTDSSTLQLTTAGPIYIAGQLYKWRKGNFASSGWNPIAIEPNAKVVPDSVKP
jgi:hypothetical protein